MALHATLGVSFTLAVANEQDVHQGLSSALSLNVVGGFLGMRFTYLKPGALAAIAGLLACSGRTFQASEGDGGSSQLGAPFIRFGIFELDPQSAELVRR